MQKSIVAHPPEPSAQHVLQDQPQELGTGECASSGLSGLGVDIAERDVAIVVGDDIPLSDHASIEIARQVFEGGFSVAHTVTVANAQQVIEEWIETARELGRPVPEPRGRLMYA